MAVVGYLVRKVPTLKQIEIVLRPDGGYPPWCVEQALRDGKRSGYAYAPEGYHRIEPAIYRELLIHCVVSIRGRLATILFNNGYALADVTLDIWVARYGFAGLDGYPVGDRSPAPSPDPLLEESIARGGVPPPRYQPGIGWDDSPPRVPFFVPIAAVPPDRTVVVLKNGLRYVAPPAEV